MAQEGAKTTKENKSDREDDDDDDGNENDTTDTLNQLLTKFKKATVQLCTLEEKERLTQEFQTKSKTEEWLLTQHKYRADMTQSPATARKLRIRRDSDNSTASTEVTARQPDMDGDEGLEPFDETEEDQYQVDEIPVDWPEPQEDIPADVHTEISTYTPESIASSGQSSYMSLAKTSPSIASGLSGATANMGEGWDRDSRAPSSVAPSSLQSYSASSLQSSHNRSSSTSGIDSDFGSNMTHSTALSSRASNPSRLQRSHSLRSMPGPGFSAAGSSVSQPAGPRSTASGSTGSSWVLADGRSSANSNVFIQDGSGTMKPITADEADQLGLGNSAGIRGQVDRNSQVSTSSQPPQPSNSTTNPPPGSWVYVPDAVNVPGQVHLRPAARQGMNQHHGMSQQQRRAQDLANLAAHTAQHGGHQRKPIEHAAGDPLFNCLGDWIQRTTSGRHVNMGQWRPATTSGGKARLVGGAPQINVHNKFSAKANLLAVQKKTEKHIYPSLDEGRRPPGGGRRGFSQERNPHSSRDRPRG